MVSHHAARVIKNFLSTQLAEAAEAQVDDEGPQEREQWSAIDVSWMDRESVDNILQKGVSWKQKDSTSTKAVKIQAQLMDAIQRSCELWAPNTGNCELLPAGSKKSSAAASSTTPPLKRLRDVAEDDETRASLGGKKAGSAATPVPRAPNTTMRYAGQTQTNARRWLAKLCAEEPANPDKKIPSQEQRHALKMVIDRCLAEKADELRDTQPRSEPTVGLLHGVPGAGKSQTLLWIRQFFEEVCG